MARFITSIVFILISYIMGTSSMAWLLGRRAGHDLKHEGSGNLGTSNAVTVLGLRAGILTLIHDILKAFIPVIIARIFFQDMRLLPFLSGCSVILGHMYPFWLKFDGGKGFACYLGMILAIDIRFFLIMLVIIVLAVVITDYIVSATFSTMFIAPLYFRFTAGRAAGMILGITSLFMLFKHTENIRNIRNHTEKKVRETLFKKK